jgi:uncharacterized protein
MTYRPRVVDVELRARLESVGAVVIEGPKACGKTETATQVAASRVLLDVDHSARQALAVDPSLVLAGDTPRLLDEWQVEPELWNHVRRAVDDRRSAGQFILTGSSVPSDDVSRHTGAGRFAFVRMRPMTLFESGHSTAAVSLTELMSGGSPHCGDPGLAVGDLAERVAVGGWPGQIGRSVSAGTRAVRDYLHQIQHVDVSRVKGEHRDPNRLGRLIASLARNTATEASASVIAADTAGSNAPLARNTVTDYVDALERLMIVENQPAWAPHMRSKAILRAAPKRHFVDPSLAVAALGANADRLLQDLTLFGLLFESLVIRDLRVFAQLLDGQVFHYRDSNGLEVDAIVQLADGRWGAFEIKLGVGSIDPAARSLRKFASIVDTSVCGEPSALCVITGSGYGYTRPDGVCVVPIGSLAP